MATSLKPYERSDLKFKVTELGILNKRKGKSYISERSTTKHLYKCKKDSIKKEGNEGENSGVRL